MAIPSINDLIYDQKRSTAMRFQHWIHVELFSWQWWAMLIVWFGAVIVWWRIADKRRIIELLMYGFMSAYLITVLDAIGTELGAWAYGHKVLPLFNRLIPVDFGALSIIYMTIYQAVKPWKTFLAVHVILGFLMAFLVEPLVTRSQVYIPLQWSHLYSFPIYIVIPVALRLVMQQLFRVQNR